MLSAILLINAATLSQEGGITFQRPSSVLCIKLQLHLRIWLEVNYEETLKKSMFGQVVCWPFQSNIDRTEVKGMATLNSSNLNRAAYRTKCRQKLADHICMTQGFDIRERATDKIKRGQTWNIDRTGRSAADPRSERSVCLARTSRETTPFRKASKQTFHWEI